jgi:hypothetical protein
MKVDVLLLANSKKMGGRCLAGIDVNTGNWIRPVPDNQSRAVPNFMTEIAGNNLIPGDLIQIEVGKPIPLPHHPEDVELIGSISLIRKRALLDYASLVRDELAKPNQLLASPQDKFSVNEVIASPMQNSLAITLGRDIKFFENEYASNRVRFYRGEIAWSLAQTDDRRSNLDPLAEALICISLAELLERKSAHYKLAAGIISTSKHEIESSIKTANVNSLGAHLTLSDLALLISGNPVEIASDERLQGRTWFRQTEIEMKCLRCDYLGIHVLRSHEMAIASKGSRVLHRFALLCLHCNYVFSTPFDKAGYGDRLREAVEKKLPVKTACPLCP